MDAALFANQLLNGVQFGLILFLITAGLSLTFGIMDFINLAHGAFYAVGAYIGATVALRTGSFFLAILVAVPAALVIGVLLEALVIRRLYRRDHLDHVLATFGLILCADAATRYFFGTDGLTVPLPHWLEQQIRLGSVTLPSYRALVVVGALLVAAGLWLVITRTRAGILVRAAASNEPMARSLGVETRLVFSAVFGIGAALAAFAGILVAPITGASAGMGDQIVILGFVVIIIGGIGSIRGAFIGALGVGLIDTLGRAYLPNLLNQVLPSAFASAAGPAIASILIYLTMTIVLLVRPAGLFPPSMRS
jgi:branched-chain amino acid transport system permease protein